MSSKSHLNILEAIENLNALVEVDSLSELEVTEEDHLVAHKLEELEEEEYWVAAGPDIRTLEVIRETFQCVHEYLQHFYHKMQQADDAKYLVKGVNTIMVLVGEAAKKAERLGTLFKERVTDFSEYKDLQSFYRDKVIKESFQVFTHIPIPQEKLLPDQEKWEEELKEQALEEEVEEIAGVHILNDLEVIKKDHLYELFYLKNEAGHNFYTYELARTIKLACDFGVYSEEYFGDDPLLQIKNWEDKGLHILAGQMLKAAGPILEKFYKGAMQQKQMELVMLVHNGVMALMLAANSRNLIRQFSIKGCGSYFQDFLFFLREILHNREYQKFLLYSPPEGTPFFHDMLRLVESFCNSLFTLGLDRKEIHNGVNNLTKIKEFSKGKSLSEVLINGYRTLQEGLAKHPSGPVFKALDTIRGEEQTPFDPLLQGNLSEPEWKVTRKEHVTTFLRVPCPITQEFIHRAFITEEFKTFLRSLLLKESLLYINYQDRTSWREHARSHAIEGLSSQAEFAPSLTVITLPKDTDFYHQAGVYEGLERGKEFVNQFADHLSDESTGFYFPQRLREKLFPQFVPDLLQKVYKEVFDQKPKLSYLERIDFITLVYHLLEWKSIEVLHPTYCVLSSKDGLDLGGTSSVGLLALIGAFSKHIFSQDEVEKIATLLLGPTLMIRERAVHLEQMERLASFLQLVEKRKEKIFRLAQGGEIHL
ncbi:MAG: hypothetical protein K940chlam9_01652 [Chlamydiae bacterium]|nr:hypothetical protein [Chlamydiota bacterium]